MATEADRAGVVTLRFCRPDARRVFVVGSFNGWNPQANPMRRAEDGSWWCELRLSPGAYQFQFLAEISVASGGGQAAWSQGDLEFLIVTPRGGTFAVSADEDGGEGRAEADGPREDALEPGDGLILPLSRIERELILGFRRLPDHESRAAFLDVLQESVYS